MPVNANGARSGVHRFWMQEGLERSVDYYGCQTGFLYLNDFAGNGENSVYSSAISPR
jgi:hypothetical protein